MKLYQGDNVAKSGFILSILSLLVKRFAGVSKFETRWRCWINVGLLAFFCYCNFTFYSLKLKLKGSTKCVVILLRCNLHLTIFFYKINIQHSFGSFLKVDSFFSSIQFEPIWVIFEADKPVNVDWILITKVLPFNIRLSTCYFFFCIILN